MNKAARGRLILIAVGCSHVVVGVRFLSTIATASLLLIGCSTSHDQLMKELVEGERDVGSPPDKVTGTALIEAAVKAQLKDPFSAEFSWPNDFRKGWYKPLLRSRVFGWYTCGAVNAKNSYGGYVGNQAVIGVIANGQVVFFDVDQGRYPLIAPECAKAGLPAY